MTEPVNPSAFEGVADPDPFRALVLEWLQFYGGRPSAARVAEVGSTGHEWIASTDGPAGDLFAVTIKWYDDKGARHIDTLRGSAMNSLWRYVVTAVRSRL